MTALHLSQSLAGGFAIIGHIWSVFLGFKGGAGGITGAATTMALYPPVGGMVWLIGGVTVLVEPDRVDCYGQRGLEHLCDLPDADGGRLGDVLALCHLWRDRVRRSADCPASEP